MNHYGIQEPLVALHDRDRALIHGFNRVFPRVHHLLCLWHMDADVEAFDAAWNELKGKDPGDKWQRAVHYVESQWLKHHRELCVKAWTDNVNHYGSSTTSIFLLGSVMDEAARFMGPWVEKQERERLTVFRFFTQLRSAFGDELTQQRALKELETLKQRKKPYQEFYTKFARLVSEAEGEIGPTPRRTSSFATKVLTQISRAGYKRRITICWRKAKGLYR